MTAFFHTCKNWYHSSSKIDNREHLVVLVNMSVSLYLSVRTSVCRSESCPSWPGSSLTFSASPFGQTGESSSECNNTPFLVSGQEMSEAVTAASLYLCNSYSFSHPIPGSCYNCIPPCHKHPDSWHHLLCVNSHRICHLRSVSSPHSWHSRTTIVFHVWPRSNCLVLCQYFYGLK